MANNATEGQTAFFLITCAVILFSAFLVGCRSVFVCLDLRRWLLFLCIAHKLSSFFFFLMLPR